MKANLLLKANIDDLLRARNANRKDLAMWCHRSEAWISKIYGAPEREIPLKYLDRIADFFGMTAHQLFQPGISRVSERRSAKDRRSGLERRAGAQHRTMLALDSTVAHAHPRRLQEAQRVFNANEIAIIDAIRADPGSLADVSQLLGLKVKMRERRRAKLVNKKTKKPA